MLLTAAERSHLLPFSDGPGSWVINDWLIKKAREVYSETPEDYETRYVRAVGDC